ncbi:MAG: ribonuclease HII [Clostridia bacterium]|nr:ribonuclease HII [Clostridia bacterium]
MYFRMQGMALICGTDEAGRGPLCGPVVAAACILPEGVEIEGLNDSKKLTEKKRERLFDEIRKIALTYCIAQATVEEIDRVNILEASLLAMRRAIEGLYPAPEAALIDGNVERDFQLPARAVIHGDALVPSIAAASILAKVTRDRMCIELDAQYPAYGIKGHKGYGTKMHMNALREHGPAPIHRARFIRFLNPDADDAVTEANPEDIAHIKQYAAWAFPLERKPDTSGTTDGLPPYILDYKHAEVDA